MAPANKRFVQVSLAILFVLTVASVIVTILIKRAESRNVENIIGCYVFEETIYTNPLSSSAGAESLPYVYGFDTDIFIIANTAGGPIEIYKINYMEKRIDADEFTSLSSTSPGTLFLLPDITGISERYLLAEMNSEEHDIQYKLYNINRELWLVSVRVYGVQSIFKISRTDATTLDDLHRVIAFYQQYPRVEITPSPGSDPLIRYKNQMTLKDVYSLSRRGERLSLSNFSLYPYWLAGDDFKDRFFEVAGGETILVREQSGNLDSAMLISRRAVDSAQAVDMRLGFEAVAEYLSPLNSFMEITVSYEPGNMQERELLFTDDYFRTECNFYLNAGGVDRAFVTFEDSGEKMLVSEALQTRRLTIEDATANGLSGVTLIPFENPLGGEFSALVHRAYTFMLGEDIFYPSKTFMYTVTGISVTSYFDFDELLNLLDLYGYDNAVVSLKSNIDPASLINIAGRSYVHEITLAGAGLKLNTGWTASLHIPVQLTFSD